MTNYCRIAPAHPAPLATPRARMLAERQANRARIVAARQRAQALANLANSDED